MDFIVAGPQGFGSSRGPGSGTSELAGRCQLELGGVEAAEGWRTQVGLSVVLLKCPFSRGVFP